MQSSALHSILPALVQDRDVSRSSILEEDVQQAAVPASLQARRDRAAARVARETGANIAANETTSEGTTPTMGDASPEGWTCAHCSYVNTTAKRCSVCRRGKKNQQPVQLGNH